MILSKNDRLPCCCKNAIEISKIMAGNKKNNALGFHFYDLKKSILIRWIPPPPPRPLLPALDPNSLWSPRLESLSLEP